MSDGIVTLPPERVELPLGQILRYMGCPPDAGEDMRALALRGAAELAPSYRACRRTVPVRAVEGGVELGDIFAPGRALAKNLSGCSRAIIFAATIGPEADRRRARAEVSSMALALALDAAGTAAAEAFCDKLCALWREELAAEGLFPRPRFSPGYGDLPLELQKPVLALLDAHRAIGLSLTQSLLMTPAKSVTAIVGIGGEGCAQEGGCAFCGLKNCRFRLA